LKNKKYSKKISWNKTEYYMNKGYITSTSNYKIFIDLLLDAKVIGEDEIEVGERIENSRLIVTVNNS
jgi:hypothetical protein